MNWIEINKKYTKAFGEYLLFISGDWNEQFKEKVRKSDRPMLDFWPQICFTIQGAAIESGDHDDHIKYDNRLCYDFFDQNDIILFIVPRQVIRDIDFEQYFRAMHCEKKQYPINQTVLGDYNNRVEAENELFKKGFELLENKLNKSK